MEKFISFISVYGGTSAVARSLGLAPNVVCNWRTRGVPIEFAAKVEKLSNGSVMRWDMFPDTWQEIWPELRKRKDAPKEAAHG